MTDHDFSKTIEIHRPPQAVFDAINQPRTGTRLRFVHVGLTPQLECFEGCSRGWTGYITDSLPNLLTTGHGRPGAY